MPISDFDFALLPIGADPQTLEDIGMLQSTIETIDMAIVSWLKEDLKLSATTNRGFTAVPVLWQAPERSFQIKDDRALRDDNGALKLPVVSVERTNIIKDPNRKGGFQANYYSKNKNGRTGRMVIAKRIVEDKTRNFAVSNNVRKPPSAGTPQKFYPRKNHKIVIQSLSIPIPVYINVEYKIVIQSEYQQQMNELVSPFMARTGQINAFVMRRNGHLYEAFIDQGFTQGNNVSDLGEEMRMFQTDVTIRVLGYLIGEGKNDDRPIVRIDENTVEFQFPTEHAVAPGNANLFNTGSKG